MKKIIICFLCFISAFSFVGCKKKTDLSTISENLTTYNICVNLDTTNHSVSAEQTVSYVNNTNAILKQIKFHLYPQFFEEGATENVIPSTKLNQAYPNGMSYADFNVERVKINNADTNPIYEGDFENILCVNLSESLLPNESIEIYFSYKLTLPNCEHRFGYGENTINLNNFYPIACVYDNEVFVTNPYNQNGEPFYSDIANYNVSVSTNSEFIIATSGEKTFETSTENTTTTTYSATAIRDFAIVASNKFEVISEQVNNTTVEYYYFNDDNAQNSLKAGVDSIKTFSKLFGKFPYRNFSIVKADFVYGGMEYPNLVMISEDITNTDDYLNVIVHETAHQWWYSLVGNDAYTYPWLDEALTEYTTILFYDHNQGYNLNHNEMVESNRANYATFVSVYTDVLGSIDTSMRAVNLYNTEPEYTYCTYVKGVLMFESLYQLIGEKDFYFALKNYYNNNKFTNTTPEHLVTAFETASKKELSNFFESWLNGKVVIR